MSNSSDPQFTAGRGYDLRVTQKFFSSKGINTEGKLYASNAIKINKETCSFIDFKDFGIKNYQL